MSLLKITMWLSLYFIIYILFSSNTLISIFCFIIVIIFIALLLFSLQIEYLTYLILLLYLGGILIFFLFTALMLNNEYSSSKINKQFSFDNIILSIFILKMFFVLTKLNFNLIKNQNLISVEYFPTYINNNFFLTNYLNNQSDIFLFASLFMEKYLLLFILGNILLFTMIGVIVITKK